MGHVVIYVVENGSRTCNTRFYRTSPQRFHLRYMSSLRFKVERLQISQTKGMKINNARIGGCHGSIPATFIYRKPKPARVSVARSQAGSKSTQEGLDHISKLAHLSDKLLVAPNSSASTTYDLIWSLIAAIPEEERPNLLGRLSAQGIKNLWELSSDRHTNRGATLGKAHSVWDDLPQDPGEVAYFDGIAALPLPFSFGINLFEKSFFLDTQTFEPYGRLNVKRGALGNWLYPGYFKVTAEALTIPATGEVADMELRYLSPDDLQLSVDSLPVPSWPRPKKHLFPFGGDLVDYLRPVGPSVYSGCGWKKSKKRFLYFVLAKRVHETQ